MLYNRTSFSHKRGGVNNEGLLYRCYQLVPIPFRHLGDASSKSHIIILLQQNGDLLDFVFFLCDSSKISGVHVGYINTPCSGRYLEHAVYEYAQQCRLISRRVDNNSHTLGSLYGFGADPEEYAEGLGVHYTW